MGLVLFTTVVNIGLMLKELRSPFNTLMNVYLLFMNVYLVYMNVYLVYLV